MTSPLAKRPLPPPRLMVISPEGVALYEGRKRIAHLRSDYPFSADEIEEMRMESTDKHEDEVVL